MTVLIPIDTLTQEDQGKRFYAEWLAPLKDNATMADTHNHIRGTFTLMDNTHRMIDLMDDEGNIVTVQAEQLLRFEGSEEYRAFETVSGHFDDEDWDKVVDLRVTPLQVCRSAAGYYIGRLNYDTGLPFDRQSVEYWRYSEEAEEALKTGKYTRRTHA